jgi:hypothetical protein
MTPTCGVKGRAGGRGYHVAGADSRAALDHLRSHTPTASPRPDASGRGRSHFRTAQLRQSAPDSGGRDVGGPGSITRPRLGARRLVKTAGSRQVTRALRSVGCCQAQPRRAASDGSAGLADSGASIIGTDERSPDATASPQAADLVVEDDRKPGSSTLLPSRAAAFASSRRTTAFRRLKKRSNPLPI